MRVLLACSALAASASAAPIAVVESGASGAQWAPRAPQDWSPGGPADDASAIAIDVASMRQEVLGFGSAITDTSAYNAMVYANADIREQFVEALWGESGLRASVNRVHINSPDYSVHSYNVSHLRAAEYTAQPATLTRHIQTSTDGQRDRRLCARAL